MTLGDKIREAARCVQGSPPVPKAQKAAVRRPIEISSAEETVKITSFEHFMFTHFGKDSAIIPGGIFITAVVLGSGLAAMGNANAANQQTFMRLRVIAQGFTICAMMTSLAVQERQKALGIYVPY